MLSLSYPNYILLTLLICVANTESQPLKEVAVGSLDCRENTCMGLDYPNRTEVAYFTEEATANLISYESLILHSSQLANMPRSVFRQLPELVELYVLECAVQGIERECFEGARNLRKLNVGGNSLKTLARNTFELATQLEELNLSDNQLEELPPMIFLPLEKLQKINLSSNRLRTISQIIFFQMVSLTSVVLDSNQLTQLPGDLFRDQRKNLSEFSAQRNLLERVPSNIFLSVGHLKLSFNPQLRRIQFRAKIYDLSATNCGLESVKLEGPVVRVQLEDNLSLNELIISQPQDLEQLYLANANLSRLDFLSKATNLVDLDVTGIENLSDLPQISSAAGLERLSFTYDNTSSDPMDMLPQLKDLNYLEITHDKVREVYIKDLDDDFFVDDAQIHCDQLADLLEYVQLPKDTTILEDRIVGGHQKPLRCGVA